MHRTFVLAVVSLLASAAAVPGSEPAALRPLAFLVGRWEASGTGQPGAGAGVAEFSRALQDTVILRTSYAEYPAADGRPSSRHDDLLVIHVAPGGVVRADYYDNEGHVIRYTVHSPAAGQAVFVSDLVAGEPRYRLTYTQDGRAGLKGEFAIAPAGSPEAFRPYLTWESRRTTDATRNGPTPIA